MDAGGCETCDEGVHVRPFFGRDGLAKIRGRIVPCLAYTCAENYEVGPELP